MKAPDLLQSAEVSLWERCLDRYEQAVQQVAQKKKKPELIQLDSFVFHELPSLVRSRSPPHLEHAELAKLMRWKLTRGKSRPLQKLVESNSSQSVISFSSEAVQLIDRGDWEGAFAALTRLKAVGVATASAFFAALAPSLCPFMADELLESICIPRNYDMKTYKTMRKVAIDKAQELGREWDAEKVGKALWTISIIGFEDTSQSGTKESSEDNVKQGTKRRKLK